MRLSGSGVSNLVVAAALCNVGRQLQSDAAGGYSGNHCLQVLQCTTLLTGGKDCTLLQLETLLTLSHHAQDQGVDTGINFGWGA